MAESKRLPWEKFYHMHWLADASLSACSLAAQGMWIRLLCFMWQSPQPGVLMHNNGKPFTIQDIGKACGIEEKQAKTLVDELGDHGVFSYTAGGLFITSRRILKDKAAAEAAAEAGRKGGNPALMGVDKGVVKAPDKPRRQKTEDRSKKSTAVLPHPDAGLPADGIFTVDINRTEEQAVQGMKEAGERIGKKLQHGLAAQYLKDQIAVEALKQGMASEGLQVDFDSWLQEVLDHWNAVMTSKLPRAEWPNPARMSLWAVVYGTEFRQQFRTVFQKILASAFLTGHGKRGWKCTLDWVAGSENWKKILDGQYDNDGKQGAATQTSAPAAVSERVVKLWIHAAPEERGTIAKKYTLTDEQVKQLEQLEKTYRP